MLNEIIKTAEELNTAALYYRQSGNMDGVRELAKAHAVSKKQTEEFIQGSRYRLVDIPIEERKFANASEKLRAEMFALKDAGFADIIGQYLVNLAKTDSALDAQVLKKHKMLQRCLDYVTQKAYNIALEEAKKKGEYFWLYSPSVLRKSGIPLSVETPAPPKNTRLSVPSIISFNFLIFSFITCTSLHHCIYILVKNISAKNYFSNMLYIKS